MEQTNIKRRKVNGGASISNSFIRTANPTTNKNALAYDDILEQVFRWLSPSDLLNCRMICQLWKIYATRKLQKMFKLMFRFKSQEGCQEWIKKVTYNDNEATETSSSFKLQALISLMKSSDLETFPCRHFRFYDGSLGDSVLQEFLTQFGIKISKLSLTVDETLPSKEQSEQAFVKQIHSLLCYQVPNLEYFYLSHKLKVEWKEGPITRSNYSTLRLTDPELGEIIDQMRTGFRNTKLRLVHYGHLKYPSAKVLETILNCSPVLQEVLFANRCSYHMLLEPLNRIHLLKRLYVGEQSPRFLRYSLSSIETAIENKQILELIQIRRLDVEFRYVDDPKRKQDITQRIINIVNRIMECSKQSLEILDLRDVPSCYAIRWPDVFPNVVEVVVKHQKGYCIFPQGFKFQNKFPRLKSVTMDVSDMEIEIQDEHKIKEYLFDPVYTVKIVTIWLSFECEYEIDEGEVITCYLSKLSPCIYKLFPNSALTWKRYY